MANAQDLARMLKALAVATRVDIVQLLRQHPLCVGALSGRLGVTQGAVSQHLRILRDAGLVTAEKRGYYVHYRLNAPVLAKWNKAIGDLLSTDSRPAGKAGPGPKTKGASQCVMRKSAARTRKS